ncbi:MAG: HAD family hydrolase [Venatoribacter sp.]
MTIKLLTFDLDHTLWNPDAVLRKADLLCYQYLVEQSPVTGQMFSQKDIWEYRLQLAQSYPDLSFRMSALREESLRRILLQSGVESNRAAQIAKDAFQVFYQARSQITFFDGAVATLEQLASKYPLIAITNGNADLNLIGINHLFKAYLNPDLIGFAKPSAEIFHVALKEAGVNASAAVHIGDNPETDVLAAKAVGMKTVWMNYDHSTWQHNQRPDAEITEIIQLPIALKTLL